MKKFYAFVQKEFYHIFRDTRTMMILFALPVALVIIFGYALDTQIENVPLVVLDLDGRKAGRELLEARPRLRLVSKEG